MEFQFQQLLKLLLTVGAIGFMAVATRLIKALVLEPRRLRLLLKKQGIGGPPPSFLLGNIKEIRKSKASQAPQSPQEMTHDCSSKLFSFFNQWKKAYGTYVLVLVGIFSLIDLEDHVVIFAGVFAGHTFVFSLGNIPILYTYDLDIVREMTTCTSLDLGKPSYQFKERGPLLGQGILTSNGATWAHQRKIIAPELYSEKVKVTYR